MISPQNSHSYSNWKPYPTETGWLSGFRLILPVASGIYGMPSNQIAITSNHQPSLAKLGKMGGITAFALDGGGFPLEVAVAFNLLKPPSSGLIIEYAESVGGNITFYIPHSLSVAWNWRDGEMRLGGTIRVVSDDFSDSEPLAVKNISTLPIRLYTAMRLAVAQIFLMAIPVAVINLSALILVVLVSFLSCVVLAGFWNQIPGNGWSKGGFVGLICAGITVLLVSFHIISFHWLFPLGVLINSVWIGGLFMGGRSSE
ncbi:MAG: hypothetical protein Q8L68_02230 [Methylococcales bacterium]|nr:hypothetical protein [Methylococcales bacterium]